MFPNSQEINMGWELQYEIKMKSEELKVKSNFTNPEKK
jgi:hypothetical protein